jgi:hypothetical protein
MVVKLQRFRDKEKTLKVAKRGEGTLQTKEQR